MTDRAATRRGVSRRSLLAIAGTGAALVSTAVLLRRTEPGAEAARPVDPAAAPVVDHDGWIVTLEDKQALVRSADTR